MAETAILSVSGRIVLPVAIRRRYGLKPGEPLTFFEEPGAIRIVSRKMALQSIRAGIIKQRGSLDGLLDEFLAEKHEEAARD